MSSTATPPSGAAGNPATKIPRQALVALALATAGFAVNFWAWALLSPLGPRFRESLDLSSSEQSLLVAVPVIVGSLGRIPVGALTDRFGGRVMMPVVSFLTVLPVLFLGLLGQDSLAALLVGGFFLGIGGTSFAVGIPLVNGWFPPARRGFALGLFGAGMGGTAISALTTVQLVDAGSASTPFLLTAACLVVYGVVAAVFLRDAPGRVAPTESVFQRLGRVARLPITLEAALLYALAFGGYVAFSVYLPTYLREAYGLEQADAARRMGGFVVLAVIMRPVGGWLSDRVPPLRVLAAAFSVVAFCALVQSSTPELMPLGTIMFLSMALALGTGTGAVFALLAQRVPAAQVGSATGFVGASGGLGGFVPPLVMGAIYGATDSYFGGLVLLSAVATVAVAWCLYSSRSTQEVA